MDLNFFKPKENTGTYKVTVHKTGKLGFSKAASDLLDVEEKKYCKIGKNPNDEGNDVLFIIMAKEKDEYTYSISKAGDYYYIKANQLLMDLEIDYKNEEVTTIYDIEKKKIDGQEVFKLNKRVLEKRKKPSS